MITVEQLLAEIKKNEQQLWFAVQAGFTDKIKTLSDHRAVLKQTLIDTLNAELQKRKAS